MGLSESRPEPRAWLDRGVAAVGRAVAWLTVAMVLLTFVIVLLRYGFNLGWIWLQESVIYLHATVFLVAAAWTLQDDGHVRVDILYRDASPRHKALVDLVGCGLLLVPFCLFTLLMSWDYVTASWRLFEGSREAGGIPAVFLLKSLIPIFAALLIAQALGIMRRCLATLRQGPPPMGAA